MLAWRTVVLYNQAHHESPPRSRTPGDPAALLRPAPGAAVLRPADGNPGLRVQVGCQEGARASGDRQRGAGDGDERLHLDAGAALDGALGLDPHALDLPGRKRIEMDHGRPIREIIA